MKLGVNYPALLHFDNFKAQCTLELLTLLDDNSINVLLIPPNCTDRLQPMDISVNKPEKKILHGKFKSWYAKQVCSQFRGESEKALIDMPLSFVKPLGFGWMKRLYDYVKSQPQLVSNGFKDIQDYLKQQTLLIVILTPFMYQIKKIMITITTYLALFTIILQCQLLANYLVYTNKHKYLTMINIYLEKVLKFSLLNQSTRRPLMAPCLKFCQLGFNPGAMAVAIAMAKTPQSFFLRHCIILISIH